MASLALSLFVDTNTQSSALEPIDGLTSFKLALPGSVVHDTLLAEALPLPHGMWWYGDEGVHRCHVDPFGRKLTTVCAGRLAEVICLHAEEPFDQAVLAYLQAAPAQARVVLWWH